MIKKKKKLKGVVFIQARMNSKRLPGKVLFKIYGKTILEHIIERLLQSKKIKDIYILTSKSKNDDPIVNLSIKKGFRYFRGSHNDVLSRFYEAAKLLDIDFVIRCNADNPFIDYSILDQMVEEFTIRNYDYLSTILKPTFPSGIHIEIFKKKILNLAHENCKSLKRREHVTPYIYHNKRLNVKNFKNKKNLSFHRWTMDYKEDYIFIKEIYKHLYKKNRYFNLNDIIYLIEQNPHLTKINYHIEKKQSFTGSSYK